ncbi:CheR family methyltransferase [Pelosinus sp. sgz500959]|uniref:CheR family methyltransferase n=1 Tax=Pelosinus sp. sgz500959 TaxID=3242472 RepID=UPI00367219F6
MIEISDHDFKKLITYIQKNYGINLSQKKNLIEGRLSNLLIEKGFDNFSEYLEYVFTDTTNLEITSLVNKLTTNHTFFMRETAHFTYFEKQVLPYLKIKNKEKDLRIWSAGCSTGEEPYTLAMIIAEYFGKEKMFWDTKLLATDISVNALGIAEEGVYLFDTLNTLPKSWKLKYFRQVNKDNYQVLDEIKREVIFRVFNLMDECFPFKQKFHVIFCRNVMIYFDHATKMRLINKFYEITEPGGYLFIGHSESIGRDETRYSYVMPAVYRKG